MKPRFWIPCVAALTIILAGCETGTQTKRSQPLMTKAVVYSTQATIVATNPATRELTLEVPNKPGDNFFDVYVGDEVENLSEVRLGDRIGVSYIQAVFVDLFRAGEVDPGIGFIAAVGSAAPHQSPHGSWPREYPWLPSSRRSTRRTGLLPSEGPRGFPRCSRSAIPKNSMTSRPATKSKPRLHGPGSRTSRLARRGDRGTNGMCLHPSKAALRLVDGIRRRGVAPTIDSILSPKGGG